MRAEQSRPDIRRLELPSEYARSGLSPESRTLYALLAAEGPLPAEDIDSAALQSLLELGLAVSTDSGVDVVPPVAALTDLAKRHLASVTAAHDAIDDLSRIWRTARVGSVGMEILSGETAIHALLNAYAAAEHEILGLSIGPRTGQKLVPAPGLLDALQRGVTVRAVYHGRLFRSAEAVAIAERCIADGEQARVSPAVPINLTIADDVALMDVSYNTDEPMHLALAHSRRVVEAWRGIFESFWRIATPLDRRNPLVDTTEEARQLVRLLSLGLTDRAIARELKVSERTIGRRVTQLQHHLGADTRFQLGLQLARRGWV